MRVQVPGKVLDGVSLANKKRARAAAAAVDAAAAGDDEEMTWSLRNRSREEG